ncbi:MAG: hypothetical protein DRP73_01850 [Candidatus Omnitrophota bacterium]|nr:MAG: hypothetical protein DRP73_01850 [Candidatus Omnitrophota bacterium]
MLYFSAVKSFEEDFSVCINHLQCPARHRKFITSTNLVERSFLEEKRRSKVIPRFPVCRQAGLMRKVG